MSEKSTHDFVDSRKVVEECQLKSIEQTRWSGAVDFVTRYIRVWKTGMARYLTKVFN